MAYSKGYDTCLFPVGTHEVMHDRLQLVIRHPADCPFKGSRLDQRKTFHPWKLALTQLEHCGLSLTSDQRDVMVAKGRQVDAAIR